MSDEFTDDITVDQNDDSQLVKDLRKQLRELAKEKATLTQENTTLKTERRSTTVADVLKAKGVNPKAAKLIPADVEATADGVTAWLNEWADVLNITVPDEDPNAGEADEVPAEERAAFERARNTEQLGGSAARLGREKVQQKLSEIKGKGSDAAFDMMREQGWME